jgi:hypothetical protein
MLVINCLKRKDFGVLNGLRESSSRRLRKPKRRRSHLLRAMLLARNKMPKRRRNCLILLLQLSPRPKTKRSQSPRSNVAVAPVESQKRTSSQRSPRKQNQSRLKRRPSRLMIQPSKSQSLRAGLSARIATSQSLKHEHPKNEKLRSLLHCPKTMSKML